ncbi:hypothetical protein ACI3LX_002605 [Candidozyma auris]
MPTYEPARLMNIVVSGLTKLITKRKLVDPNEAKILCTCDHLNEIEEFFTLKDQSLYEINRQLQGDNTGKFKIAERNHDDIEHSVSTRKIELERAQTMALSLGDKQSRNE